ncbi:STAS domain-containing protein [Caenimonas aquaedulcis]|uniref:STAS domain-containing protein n=1 Tax=Caenimonas aquaedulcis TaxID=2793270 RepID=A0A931H222_9BURK|nr:STAS domain-containing protein [Caenimonas aquaedulcis]MBG9387059.1 STAS domain-containing protein [Caenimonas aquaedulcis]
MTKETDAILSLIGKDESQIAAAWLQESGASSTEAGRRTMQGEINDLLSALVTGLKAGGDATSFQSPAWAPLREALTALSRSRVAQGQSAGDTSGFVLAVKRALFSAMQRQVGADSKDQFDAIWAISSVVDRMAQWTVTTYQQSREEVIKRQQAELLELSTPVIKLWEGVLAVPMIGTLDSARTQLVMEALLQRIVETGSQLAIIDITGVPTVDTLVAQHLLKTVSAIRLMGADCIISGIRPQIAQTIVHLGIDLQGIATKASLADALLLALQQGGYKITRDADAV